MGVHENIIRLITEGDDDNDRTIDEVSSTIAREQYDQLKQAYLRLGSWDKSKETYKELVDDLLKMPEHKGKVEWKDAHGIDSWDSQEKPVEGKKFTAPLDWTIVDLSHEKPVGSPGLRRPGMAKRASSRWGLGGLLHELFHANDEEEQSDVLPVRRVEVVY